ncbi:MAG: ferritin family protein [bacterium]
MDLKEYSMEDIYLTVMRSEINSKNLYIKLANKVKNALLKDRLKFLASEEEKHRVFFEALYKKTFPGKEIFLPEKNIVPLPDIKIIDESTPVSEIMSNALKVELASYDFYVELSKQFEHEPQIKNFLLYIASMEMSHYKLIEVEKENAEKFEYYNIEWPMIHIGP